MKYLTDNELFNVFLLCTIIGEFLLPCLLERYYTEYNGKTMVMSALGSSQSPVRLIYNLWLIWLGSFFTFTAFVYFEKTRVEFPVLSALLSLSIGIFAIGAGLISGFFSVNENKSIVTPLINGILSFKQKEVAFGVVSIISFILALICFMCFVMGDKKQFQNTVLIYEGLWERLTLICMYIPFIHKAVYNLLS